MKNLDTSLLKTTVQSFEARERSKKGLFFVKLQHIGNQRFAKSTFRGGLQETVSQPLSNGLTVLPRPFGRVSRMMSESVPNRFL